MENEQQIHSEFGSLYCVGVFHAVANAQMGEHQKQHTIILYSIIHYNNNSLTQVLQGAVNNLTGGSWLVRSNCTQKSGRFRRNGQSEEPRRPRDKWNRANPGVNSGLRREVGLGNDVTLELP